MVKTENRDGTTYHVTTVRISSEAYNLSQRCKKSKSKMLEEAIFKNAGASNE